jgi:hypothetical protein
MFKKTMALSVALLACNAFALDTPIIGQVESKCMVTTDKQGVYGNPTASTLSTDAVDGGVEPVVRFDVVLANAYKAVIAHPTTFSQSPQLTDVIAWTGSTAVEAVSDAGMSAYDTSKVEYDNVTEIELTIAGSTWFKVSSEADYGYNKALPGGTYTAIVEANCIAL